MNQHKPLRAGAVSPEDGPIPFLDLRTQYRQLQPELLQAVVRVLESGAYILGPEVEALEREIAAYLGAAHGIAVASGTDALFLALRALDIGPGDEVVTSAYSFFASAGAILQTGATPVFVDIDPQTFNLDPAGVARALTSRTRALMPVHLYGQCADMQALQPIADQAGVPIVEDAAQAIGALSSGRAAGTMGLLGCLSFYPTKNLGGLGDGGMILTSDPKLRDRLLVLRNHGQTSQYVHECLGHNSRLDALNAAALRVKLPHLRAWTEARREHAERYRLLFEKAGLAGSGVGLPSERDGAFHVYNQFVVRLEDRDAVRSALQREGIASAVYYPRPLPSQPCLSATAGPIGAFPQADAAARQTLALPIYPELAPAQQERIVEVIARSLRPAPA